MKTARKAAPARGRPGRAKVRLAHAGARLELAVQYATRSRGVPAESDFRKWVRAALRGQARVTVRIVDTAESRALNRTYRARDYATNVLTFVLRDGPPFEGDVALCAPLVTREARAQAKDVKAHYAHLTVHGILHLQGYEHEDDRKAAAMERLETRILKRLGYADPYNV